MGAAFRSFAHRVDIGAPVQRVWRAFTDGRILERWTAPGATVTPRENGRMHVTFGGIEHDAHIDVMVTPQRLRLILMPVKGMPPAVPGAETAIVEDFLFEKGPSAKGPSDKAVANTAVRLLSSGVPSSPAWVTYYLQKRRHWELALTRLKVFLEKGLDERQPEPRY